MRRSRFQSNKSRPGFTLVELLLVMLIIGILAGIAYGRFQDSKARGFKAAMTSDLGELRIAQEAFWAENQQYSTTASVLDWRPTSNVTVNISSGDTHAGYDAEARHTALPGIVCRMYVGRSTSARPSGEVYCS